MSMILVLHIVTALSSLALSTLAIFSPSRNKLNVVYGLAAATLASGTYLVVSMHASLVSSCTSGLLYLVTVSVLAMTARKRLLN